MVVLLRWFFWLILFCRLACYSFRGVWLRVFWWLCGFLGASGVQVWFWVGSGVRVLWVAMTFLTCGCLDCFVVEFVLQVGFVVFLVLVGWPCCTRLLWVV